MKEMFILTRLSTSFRMLDKLISVHPTEEGARAAQREYRETIPARSRSKVIVQPVKLGE